ncbi:hypothetical protein OH458_21700 [Vibrio sp. MarTm2]|jgi:hypothetical protein|uniref:hypothetical protein n=1 Tax=Vibrio sp. MarTm2 TaxID=2998831 RepID=UPI0022CDA793|nr:hypothetical protein [Vibrio sp. MarTm2]MDA0130682.1 hypothetical protein [Vibrio sp. MarTm2]
MPKKRKASVYPEPISTPKTRKDTGFRVAKVGAAIGARFGVAGIISGGVLGFIAGVIVDEVLED